MYILFIMYSGCKICLTLYLNVLNNYETTHFRQYYFMRLKCTIKTEDSDLILLLTSHSNLSLQLWKISSVIKAFPVHYTNMAAGSLCVLCVCLLRCHKNKQNAKGLSTFPSSPHSVGLITTSYSVLRPLRKASHIAQTKCTCQEYGFSEL